MYTKEQLYDEAVAVPLIVACAGTAAQVDRDHLVSGLDILPTILDYAGIRAPSSLLGKSLKPIVSGQAVSWRDFVVSETGSRTKARMVRTSRYKYILFSEGTNCEQLFDMDADPGETRNLAGDPSMKAELDRHKMLLKAWIQSTKDEFGTFIDSRDGETYKTVKIGTQTWMAENLKTTKFNDGTFIPFVTDNTEWSNLTTPGYCWYNNNEAAYKATYGALYNWHTVSTGKLCPTGWHVPSDVEWTTLTSFLGGGSVALDKLKEIGLTHWLTRNTGATNETSFTALPGGYRGYDGTFGGVGDYSGWWSSTELSSASAFAREMGYGYTDVKRLNGDKLDGFSVRCLQD
jgi:uncharacterized protein (TIGR02145 family)